MDLNEFMDYSSKSTGGNYKRLQLNMKTIHWVKDEPIPLDGTGGIFGFCADFPIDKIPANYHVPNYNKKLNTFKETLNEHPNMSSLEYPLNLGEIGGELWIQIPSLLNSLKEYVQDDFKFKNPISCHWLEEESFNNGKGIWRCHPGTTRLFIAKLFSKEKDNISSWIYTEDKTVLEGLNFEPLPTYKDFWNKVVDECTDAVKYRKLKPLMNLVTVQMLNAKIQPYGNYPNIAIGLEHVMHKDMTSSYNLARSFFEGCEVIFNGEVIQEPLKKKVRTVRCVCNQPNESKKIKAILLMMICHRYKCPEDLFWFTSK